MIELCRHNNFFITKSFYFFLLAQQKQLHNHLPVFVLLKSSHFAIDLLKYSKKKINKIQPASDRSIEKPSPKHHGVAAYLCELVLAKIEGGVANV